MRSALSIAIDVAAIAILGYLAFRLAILVLACKNLGNCPLLTPVGATFVLLVIVLYFVAGYWLWHRTPGEALLRK